MSIKVEILAQHHIDAILPRLQDFNAPLARDIRATPDYLMRITKAGPCRAFSADGKVLALAGLVDYTPQRSFLWCAFANDGRQHFSALFKKMLETLMMTHRKRYEAYIDPHFTAAKRFAKAGGFQYEGLMRAFQEDGSDRELWARVTC